MTAQTVNTLNVIHTVKHKPFGSVFIEGTIHKNALRLDLLTKSSIEDPHIIRLLARWRKKHADWFPSQFPVTQIRTKKWLEKGVIDQSDRLLFMIYMAGVYRGHVGLYRFNRTGKTCEIDNIVRGRNGVKGMMEASIRLLMQWGKETLGITGYTLQTTSDNIRAIALYTRLGFAEVKRTALVYEKVSDGGQWVRAPKTYSGTIHKYDVYMKWGNHGKKT